MPAVRPPRQLGTESRRNRMEWREFSGLPVRTSPVKKPSLVIQKVLLVILLSLLVVQTADARKRRQHRVLESDVFFADPDWRSLERSRRKSDRRKVTPISLAAIAPRGWQLQPPEANWQGKRFKSPDGAAWLAIYKEPADVPVADHMKSVVFAGEGETLTHIQGERSWIAAAGFKGSRMFYRKAILACGGRVWHHVAFEYPPETKARVDRFILLASEGLHDSQTDCDEAVTERR
jgi:hypothetical protein